ncbi:MAG TPA: TIGR04053 family radical SAM/SPASM domain-containing protein [Vicinamibacteria bacterium]|nr:TIGR04053 family radical SAM/SPASM domain-containing protein [Vicinamibacteria bacterium]
MTTTPFAPAARASGPPLSMKSVDFQKAPFLVIWETTQACALACRHCRASARPGRDPLELTTDEGRRVVRQTAEMGTPLIVFSGGDPVSRPDLADLIAEGKACGLRTATIPAATDKLTADLVSRLKEAGLDQLALSLDFPDAALHDAFRGVPGAFEKTMRAVAWAHGVGLPLQINTTLCADTVPYLKRMAAFVETLGIVFWEVFFLVPTGRGSAMGGLRPEECERLFAVLHEVQEKSSFIVKVTEAPHYRRHVAQHVRHAAGHRGRPHGAVEMPSLLTTSEGPGHTVGLAPRGVNAGNGFLFVSHRGEVFPSGFLPVAAGSVRERHLADIYRNAPLMRALREPHLLKGRCGYCEFRQICGGSRSRAFALTGDPFATDPWCAYQPARPDTPRAELAPAAS